MIVKMLRTWLVVLLLSVTLIFTDRVVGLQFLRSPVQQVVGPIEYGLRKSGRQVLGALNFVSSLPFVYQENQRLQDEIKNLYSTRLQAEQLKTENRALRKQLKVAGAKDKRQVLARVLGGDPRRGAAFLVVDKGGADGVKEGQTAYVDGQLVGRVSAVSGRQSVIETIYSTQTSVPVKIKDNLAILQGEFGFHLRVEEILQEAEINPGDLVVTSGIGGVYRPDLLVGKVEKLEVQENQPFKTAAVEPFWRPAEISTVFLD